MFVHTVTLKHEHLLDFFLSMQYCCLFLTLLSLSLSLPFFTWWMEIFARVDGRICVQNRFLCHIHKLTPSHKRACIPLYMNTHAYIHSCTHAEYIHSYSTYDFPLLPLLLLLFLSHCSLSFFTSSFSIRFHYICVRVCVCVFFLNTNKRYIEIELMSIKLSCSIMMMKKKSILFGLP